MGVAPCSSAQCTSWQTGCTPCVRQPCMLDRLVANRGAVGLGGPLQPAGGRVACLVVAFDYSGYPAEDAAGCEPLDCVANGRRLADLAGASAAELAEFYDQPDIAGNLDFPRKQRVLEEVRRFGDALGPDDVFVLYFAGHGTQTNDGTGYGDGDEQLCFVERNGAPNFLQGDEMAAVLLHSFQPTTRVLMVSDCCRAGSWCGVSGADFEGRPICHLSAVHEKGGEEAERLTLTLLKSVQNLVRNGNRRFSVVEVFNECLAASCGWLQWQDLHFDCAPGFDPDTFAWPLTPPWGWEVQTDLEHQSLRVEKGAALAGPWERAGAFYGPDSARGGG